MKTIILFSLLTILSSGCFYKSDWTIFRGNQGKGRTWRSISPPLGIKWKLKLQNKSSKARTFNPPVIQENTVYFGSADNNFYALDIESGYMNWVYETSAPINSLPTFDKENVYFGSSNGTVYAVSKETGKEKWSFDSRGGVNCSLIKYKNKIIFTSDEDSTYFLSSKTGRKAMSLRNPIWSANSFQIYKDVIYFAPGPLEVNYGLSLGAYDIKKMAFLWTLDVPVEGAVWISFAAVEKKLIFYGTCKTTDGQNWIFNFIAKNRLTGKTVWENADTPSFGKKNPFNPATLFDENVELLDYLAPAIVDNTIIYTCGDSLVRAFDIKTGKVLWTTEFPLPASSAPIIAGNRVYFGIRGVYPDKYKNKQKIKKFYGKEIPSKLVCLSAKSGHLLWEMEIEGDILSAPVIAGKWMIFGTDQNFFYILEEVY